jgi:hypothetical protein
MSSRLPRVFAERRNPIGGQGGGDAGWSLGSVSAVDREGRTIWIADAHDYEKRFVVHADKMLTAFVQLQRAIHAFAVSLIA